MKEICFALWFLKLKNLQAVLVDWKHADKTERSCWSAAENRAEFSLSFSLNNVWTVHGGRVFERGPGSPTTQ